MAKQTKTQDYVNKNLLDRISPFHVDFKKKPNLYIYDEQYVQAFVITRFPVMMEYGWLSNVTKIKNVTVSAYNKTVSKSDVKDKLDQALSNMKLGKSDGVDEETEDSQISLSKNINKQLYEEKRNVFLTTIVCSVHGDCEDTLKDNIENFKNELSALGLTAQRLNFLQEQGARMTLPYAYIAKEIADSAEQMFITTTVAGSFMFNNVQLKDSTGIILGRDENDNVVTMNMWERDKITSRNNSNMIIIGESGVGKSSTTKSLLTDEYANGTTIIIIDPEREYKGMAHEFDGQWINMSGGKNKINYFQIRDVKEGNEDGTADEDEYIPPYISHLRLLEVFFKIYLKDFTETELDRLSELVEQMYKKWGINKDTDISKLTPESYFIAEDFYEYILEVQEEMKKSKTRYTDNDLDMIEKIRIKIRKMSQGADANLLNGRTNVELKSQFIVFDIFDLQNSDDTIKRTQYFNILSYAFERLTADRTERVLLVIDEAHILIDKDVLDTVKQLRTFQKRVRKYSSALLLATQELNDFMHGAVKDYGVSLLDNATYKFLMGADGENLKAMKEVYKLTENEETLIAQKETGVVLLLVGNQRLKVDVVLPEYVQEICDIQVA